MSTVPAVAFEVFTAAPDRWWPLEELLAVAVRPWQVMMVG